MKKENPHKILLETFGEELQFQLCIEEMGELLQAISKYKRKLLSGTREDIAKAKEHMKEEIADVLFTTEQLAYMFGEKEINEIKEKKKDRALVRAKNNNTEFGI